MFKIWENRLEPRKLFLFLFWFQTLYSVWKLCLEFYFVPTTFQCYEYILLSDFFPTSSGFPPGRFEREGPKGVGGLGALPQKKKIRVFTFWCLKLPILTEMTVKYGKYILIILANKGGISPPVVLSGGVQTPPGGNPVVEPQNHLILKCLLPFV